MCFCVMLYILYYVLCVYKYMCEENSIVISSSTILSLGMVEYVLVYDVQSSSSLCEQV